MSTAIARVVGAVVLLVAGVLSLPAAASVLDGPGTEDYVVPVQLVAMAALGAVAALVLPGLARAGATPARRALTGAWWGLLAAFAGVVVFWLLLNGLGGA